MVKYSYPDNIYPVFYNDQVIALDISNNNYIILSERASSIFALLVEGQLVQESDPNVSQTIESFMRAGLLEKNCPGKIYLGKCNKIPRILSRGTTTVNWQVEYGNLDIPVGMVDFAEAYFYLTKVNRVVRGAKLQGLVSYLASFYKPEESYTIPTTEEADLLTTLVNRAAFYYFKRVKCLEWAATYVILALKRNWKASLVVGVQNYPFLAHAWPEINSIPSREHRKISDGLAKLLSIPF